MATLAPDGTLNVLGELSSDGIPVYGPLVTGLDTSAMSAGRAGYVSANDTVMPTNSAALASSVFAGFHEGVAGSLKATGVLAAAAFTTAGGTPSPGAAVYLAAAADDGGTGAGKLTASPPATGFLAEVGLVLNNSDYAASKTCRVLIQVKGVIAL